MFDLGWSEMLVVLVIAIVVVGPKDLPKAVASISRYIRKARSMARDFQSGMDQLAKDTEFDEIQKEMKKATDFDIKNQLEEAMGPIDLDAEDDIKPEILDEAPEPGPETVNIAPPDDDVAKSDSSEVKAS
jgi:sec-independent protein translocase protein TatB